MGLSSVGPEKAWQIAVDHLKMDMPKATFDTWVQHCEFVSFENGRFTIGVYNPYNREWLASRLTSTLVRLLTGIMNQTVEIEFTVLEQAVDEEENVDPEPQAHSSARQEAA
jgi:chromosomal replication initiation ATPase DnaA